MKNIFKILFAFIIGILVVSCDKDEDFAVADAPSSNPTLKSDKTSLVLIKDNADQTAVTFTWQNPSYGSSLAVNNVLQIAKKGTNFASPKETVIADGVTSKSFTVQDFNSLMLNVGLEVNTTADIEARIKSSVNGSLTVLSQTVAITVKPYALISYLYAPGAYQGWNPTTANTLTSATSNGIYIGIINFTDVNSEFKVTPARNWDNSYGSTGGNNLTYNGGDNLKAPKSGTQKLTVNLNTNTYLLADYSWGIIGSATPTGWDADTDLVWNETTGKWEITLPLIVGEIKFRLNNAWDTNYGDTGNNGSLEAGGDNIPITVAGNYKITFDEVNLTWTKTKL